MTPLSMPTMQTFGVTVLLVDDQPIIAEAVRRMLEDQRDIAFYYCQDPTKAIQMAEEVRPTVILQDLVMPELDGLVLVRYMRANPRTKNVPLIVLSTKEEPKTKAEAFALGANDYMVKLPDKLELVARIRYHSSGYIRLLERNEAYDKLAESQRILHEELMEAAAYVKSLLPAPLSVGIPTATWTFIPSTQLGGDAFGYYWIDDEHFCFYLLDVCGHGVGAAVMSISVMNVMRAQSLPNTDFRDPSSVLASLNEMFPMEKHNNRFFTMFYGVYNKVKREIVYANGGHPPPILFMEGRPHQELQTGGFIVGGMEGMTYTTAQVQLTAPARLYLFSDGVYEIAKEDGSVYSLQDFISVIEKKKTLDAILVQAREWNGKGPFADDYSLIEFLF